MTEHDTTEQGPSDRSGAHATLETPEADALDQATPTDPAEQPPTAPTLGLETPEADALDQATPADPAEQPPTAPTLGLETPEADALDQSIAAPLDDEDDE